MSDKCAEIATLPSNGCLQPGKETRQGRNRPTSKVAAGSHGLVQSDYPTVDASSLEDSLESCMMQPGDKYSGDEACIELASLGPQHSMRHDHMMSVGVLREQSPACVAQVSRAQTAKRQRRSSSPERSHSPEDQLASADPQVLPEQNEEKIQLLACPFYKWKPMQYVSCQSYLLRRVKDVKQHIRRRHSKPAFYCARCYRIFANAKLRDHHTRTGGCQIQEEPLYEGITEQQDKKLNMYLSRNKPVTEQWNDMFRIIFPHCPLPSSCYLGNYLEETLPLLRLIWATKHAEIISSISSSAGDGIASCNDLDIVMSKLFDRLEVETSRVSTNSLSMLPTSWTWPSPTSTNKDVVTPDGMWTEVAAGDLALLGISTFDSLDPFVLTDDPLGAGFETLKEWPSG